MADWYYWGDGELIDEPIPASALPKWIWGLVANVRKHPASWANLPERKRTGTKHFAAGTRVYVYYNQWGDGMERVIVIGKRKGDHRYIRTIMEDAMLENHRLKKVYSPTIISWMTRNCPVYDTGEHTKEIHNFRLPDGWDDTDFARQDIESIASFHEERERDPEGFYARIRAECAAESARIKAEYEALHQEMKKQEE